MRTTALVGCALACSDPSGPRWIHLAEGFTPSTRIETETEWVASALGGKPLRLSPAEGDGAWVTAELPASAWAPAPFGDSVWRAQRPMWGVGAPPTGDDQLLRSGAAVYDYVPFSQKLLEAELPAGTFTSAVEFVYLRTNGAVPPDCRYVVYVDRGQEVDGRWRVGLERFLCDGIPLWPGHAEELTLDVPATSALYFHTAALATARELGQSSADVTFRVLLDGEEVASFEQPAADLARSTHRVVALPRAGRAGATLRFEASGPAAVGAVLDPVVGPADIGRPGARPWEEERPNVVLFVADTFRADNMQAYGARHEPSLTPNLDALAERALVFQRAWSTSSWTLPSQASMMSGLFPHQHGATSRKVSLDPEVETLAERFADAGYRTGAVTDSLYLSNRFGFDQGFQWFDELLRDFEDTTAAVTGFLDADDGRPFLLWVQTYRTHSPYKVSERTRAERPDLEIDGDWDSVFAELNAVAGAWGGEGEAPPNVLAAIDEVERLYRGGVVDFDRTFGELLAAMSERSLDASTWMLFTSDHGEAFGEHDVLFHGNGVWDANVRIPFLVSGPDLEPQRSAVAASLVDVPRTLAALAGVAPSSRWGGRDLLAATEDEPTFVFETPDGTPADGTPGDLAIIDGARKVLLPDSDDAVRDAQVLEAYHLTVDRDEERDLHAAGEAWPEELARQHEERLRNLRLLLLDPPRAALRAADVAQLEALGYVDASAEDGE